MSGHSKWHSIRHKKASVDSKRGRLFTRLIKEISVAARMGGGDVDSNPRLRAAVQSAKGANMPQDNIKRAIMKGTGELPGQSYESVSYEGYGPGGVAVFIEGLTDNRNRTVAEIRHILSKQGGTLAEAGSVQWIFDRKGQICVKRGSVSEEAVLEAALEAGADDIKTETDTFDVYTTVDNFEGVRQVLESAGLPIESSALTLIPQNSVHLEGKQAEQMFRLMDALDEHEDIASVYANFEIDEAEMETLAGG